MFMNASAILKKSIESMHLDQLVNPMDAKAVAGQSASQANSEAQQMLNASHALLIESMTTFPPSMMAPPKLANTELTIASTTIIAL